MYLKKKTGGFLLVEILVAVALVAIAAAGLGRVLHHAVHALKTSSLRLQYQVRAASWRDRLLSAAYEHSWLQEGEHQHREGDLSLYWRVTNTSPERKEINLIIQDGEWKTQSRFIKSIFLHHGPGGEDPLTHAPEGGES